MPAKKTTTKSTKAKKSTAKKAPKTRTASKKAKPTAGEQEVTIDRRRTAGRCEETPEVAQPQRREKVQRRRQIDPTTCERDYSDTEVQFMNAMDEYKRTSGRMFPTCSEVLEVIRGLGYVQLTPAEMAKVRPEPTQPELVAEGDQDEFDEADLEVEEFAC